MEKQTVNNSFLTIHELNIINEFSKPIFSNKYYISMDGLIKNSKIVNFDLKWEYNPQQFCFDYYKKYMFYPVILLVNNVNTIFEFKNEKLNNKIIAPLDHFIMRL